MSASERILDVLAGEQQKICDDCLTTELDISSRHYTNHICTGLAVRGDVRREKGLCERCGHRLKTVNWVELDKAEARFGATAADDASGSVVDIPPWVRASRRGPQPAFLRKLPNLEPAERERDVSGIVFRFLDAISPQRDSSGSLVLEHPHLRARKPYGAPHKYGRGPFCRFQVATRRCTIGVYAVTVDGEVKYVGKCGDLSQRWNSGYGRISPRNCFNTARSNGRETNCRINALIRDAAQAGRMIELWFHPTLDHSAVEKVLISALAPPWNLRR